MYDEQLLARIREYLRQNQGRFTPEALRRKLISEGVDPTAIDVAAAQLRSEGPPVHGMPPYGGPAAAPAKKVGFGRVLLLTTGVVVFNLLAGVAGFYGMVAANNGYVFLGITGSLFVAEVTGAVVYFRRNTNVSVALLLAIVATPVVVFALLLGACILFIASEGRIAG